MLDRLLLPALNHLLQQAPWAQERLRPFAGQQVLLAMPPLKLHLAISQNATFTPASADGEPAVSITLPADTPFRFVGKPESVFAAARIEGSAEFAEAIAFVFRNLRWHPADDLAPWIGDIAANRLVKTGEQLLSHGKAAASNLASNVSEALVQDNALLPTQRELNQFCDAADSLRDDLARLEKRLALLEK